MQRGGKHFSIGKKKKARVAKRVAGEPAAEELGEGRFLVHTGGRRLMEQLYREAGKRNIGFSDTKESTVNWLLKNDYRVISRKQQQFIQEYLEAEDKSRFRKDDVHLRMRISLMKRLSKGPVQKGRHSILAIGRDGKEKWHYISKEALERA